MADFAYSDLLPTGEDTTTYRKLTSDGVRTLEGPGGRTFLEVDPSALETLSATAMHDIAHYLRTSHLAQLRKILDDPEASNNDKFVALDLLKNANIAAAGVLPMCQDTARRSSWARRVRRCSSRVTSTTPLPTRRRSRRASTTRTRNSICATARWRR